MLSRRVLIIEDDADAAGVLEAYLRRENYDVVITGDGLSGLDMAHRWKPDLILLDVMLPGLNGTEVLAGLRRKNDVPVIMVTAMGGALAAFIKNAGVANAVAETVVQFSIPGIIIPILIAALIHVITGSNALGVMTAAALVEPMLGALGISPLAAFLACGTGALMFKHANSSGFWVTVTMSNMDIRQGIRAVGGGSTVAGVTGAAITVILHFAGII